MAQRRSLIWHAAGIAALVSVAFGIGNAQAQLRGSGGGGGVGGFGPDLPTPGGPGLPPVPVGAVGRQVTGTPSKPLTATNPAARTRSRQISRVPPAGEQRYVKNEVLLGLPSNLSDRALDT